MNHGAWTWAARVTDDDVERWDSPLMIESGWWRGLQREERTCRECQAGTVEDVTHWLLECNAWCTKRQPLLANDFDNLCKDDKLVLALDKGCQHLSILKSVMMRTARF